MYTLYGDGVHDDTAAIQEMIDSGSNEVSLPSPEKFYVISKPLELPSNFRLVLPRFAEIRLADNSNCVMLRNKMVKDYAKRLSPDVYEKDLLAYLWSYIDDYSPDAPCQNIEISGGVWNCNNQNQLPNPERKIDLSVREFYGCGMLFYLTVRSLHRRERILPKDTIHIGEQAVVDRLILDDITTENYTGEPMILLNNCGTIRYLSMRNIDSGNDRTLVNSGIIENCVD